MPARLDKSTLVIRPSSCREARMRRSIASSRIGVSEFGGFILGYWTDVPGRIGFGDLIAYRRPCKTQNSDPIDIVVQSPGSAGRRRGLGVAKIIGSGFVISPLPSGCLCGQFGSYEPPPPRYRALAGCHWRA